MYCAFERVYVCMYVLLSPQNIRLCLHWFIVLICKYLSFFYANFTFFLYCILFCACVCMRTFGVFPYGMWALQLIFTFSVCTCMCIYVRTYVFRLFLSASGYLSTHMYVCMYVCIYIYIYMFFTHIYLLIRIATNFECLTHIPCKCLRIWMHEMLVYYVLIYFYPHKNISSLSLSLLSYIYIYICFFHLINIYCMYACMHVLLVFVCAQKHIHTYTYSCMSTYKHSYTYMLIHLCTHTHTYMNSHA